MITTVTLNAAIDKTYYLTSLPKGHVSRMDRLHAAPGGKGINVAKVVSQLGMAVTATGFVGGMNGEWIKQQLSAMGVSHDFVVVEGESRLCLNMLDAEDQSSTEILEPGPSVEAESLELMKLKIMELAAKSEVVCFSGSLPVGVPKDYYVSLIEIAKQAGAYVILDTSGEALRLGLEAKPNMIKPNEEEVAALLGIEVQDESALRAAMLKLEQKYEMDRLIVSLGGAGSLTLYQGRFYRATCPPVQVINTVGCGDSFVAGTALAIAQQLEVQECLRISASAGTANAMTEQAGSINIDAYEQLRQEVKVTQD
ncbi:1-phosphofructokinase [Paenibacillus pini]|uniref:Tagatose-6-phosphate kinase n=1 Tax=Paenibacillus pini JCM 16418 TaxID=1236976 RepID=W7YT61_9BACL|nr:1-phosphofructokinase [Paenibacillus pini]GAF07821.1 tagatose-6-phosphate kinase [Paenibacillus pini JCM 16418]